MIYTSLALLPAAGYCYQYFAAKRDEQTYPPPGELIDVEGHQLHIQCAGPLQPGVPTVIIETGIWDCSQSWQLVQKELANRVRICTYDRAGYGWSDSGPKPRTFDQMTLELKTLIEKKGLKPPFIFVGHSLGGPIIRYYHSQYPEEVAGMIFVDALHKKEPKFSPIFRVVSKAFSFLAHFAVLRLMFRFSPPISANPLWTPTMQKIYMGCHQAKISTLNTCIDEWDAYSSSFEKLREKAKSLEDIPVTIISRDPKKPMRPGMTKEAIEKERKELKENHQQYIKDVPHARFVIAEQSGHLVQIDRPDIIVDEIQRMIADNGSRKNR